MINRVAFVSVLSLLLAPETAEGAPAFSNEDRLVLVHSILGEAGWRPRNDHPAILHVLERRRKLPTHVGKNLTEMAKSYSNFLNEDREETPHRRAVFATTLETAPRWAVRLVDKFLANPRSIKDPCKGKAWNWGGHFEVGTNNPHAVDCGSTANVFLGLAPRGEDNPWQASN
jgi:hypothetical protein